MLVNNNRLEVLKKLRSVLDNEGFYRGEAISITTPNIWRPKSKLVKAQYEVFISTITMPDPKLLGLSLDVIPESGHGCQVHAAFDLNTGNIVGVRFEDSKLGDLEVSYEEDGTLFEGEKWQSKLAEEALDHLLSDLCVNIVGKQR